jgi:hypothetical protein
MYSFPEVKFLDIFINTPFTSGAGACIEGCPPGTEVDITDFFTSSRKLLQDGALQSVGSHAILCEVLDCEYSIGKVLHGAASVGVFDFACVPQ